MLAAAAPVTAPTRVSTAEALAPAETLRCVATATAAAKEMEAPGLRRLAEAVTAKAFTPKAHRRTALRNRRAGSRPLVPGRPIADRRRMRWAGCCSLPR